MSSCVTCAALQCSAVGSACPRYRTRGRAPLFGAARGKNRGGWSLPGGLTSLPVVLAGQAVTAQDEGHGQMIPPAGATHLDHVDLELPVVHPHPVQLGDRLGLAAGGPELVAVHVVDVDQPLLAADRAGLLARLAVVAGGVQQVRVGVARIEGTGPPGVEVGEDRAPLQRVVHDLSTGPHRASVRGALGSAAAVRVIRGDPRVAADGSAPYRADVSARYIASLAQQPNRG